jgi:MFS superfamily sulfate permease-like transporter
LRERTQSYLRSKPLRRLDAASAIFLLIIAVLCVRWTRELPPAGVAIGALGAASVIVALMGEQLGRKHRILWR